MENKKLNYTKICREALKIMLSIKDGTHNVEHIVNVYNWSRQLAKNYPEVDLNVLKVSAYWHDVGRKHQSKEKDDHNIVSGEMVEKYLREEGVSEEFISKVKQAVINHGFTCKPENIEGKIVHDADKLAFLTGYVISDAYLSMKEGYENETFSKKNQVNALRNFFENENILYDGLILPESKKYYKIKKKEFYKAVEKIIQDQV